MNYDELKPGPRLNGLVAEKVMGWRYASTFDNDPKFWQDLDKDFVSGYLSPPPFSTIIEWAWKVVEKFCTDVFSIGVGWDLDWGCTIFTDDARFDADGCETAAHAICIAALKAMEAKQ